MSLARQRDAALVLAALVIGASCGGDGITPPADQKEIPQIDFASITSGARHSCGVTESGEAYCWVNGQGPERIEADVAFRAVEAGALLTCGLSVDGDLYCWGISLPVLGQSEGETPVLVAADLGLVVLGATVGYHMCGLTAAREAWCWGQNWGGALGAGQHADGSRPIPVATDLRFKSITAGNSFTCAVALDDSAYCWGSFSSRQSSYDPRRVSDDLRFDFLAAGQDHICGVTAGGLANYCWGRNDEWQVGTGDSAPWIDDPVPLLSAASMPALSTGELHTCGITAAGDAYCWGSGEFGRLGTGDYRFGETPQPVAGSHRFAQVAAGDLRTCGLTREGDVYCWGAIEEDIFDPVLTPKLVSRSP